MRDTRWKSLTEGFANVVVGFPISYLSNIVILIPYTPILADSMGTPWMYFHLGVIGVFYTLWSVARQYVLRRAFNRIGPRENAYTILRRLWRR